MGELSPLNPFLPSPQRSHRLMFTANLSTPKNPKSRGKGEGGTPAHLNGGANPLKRSSYQVITNTQHMDRLMEPRQSNSFTAPLINNNQTPLNANEQKPLTLIRDADKITSWLGRHQQLMMLPVLALGMTIGSTIFANHIYKMDKGLVRDFLGVTCLVVIPASSIIVYSHHTSK